MHKQIALQDSSNTVETVLKAGAEAGTLSRALSVERDLHRGKSAAGPLGKASESAALTSPSQHAQKAIAPAKVRIMSSLEEAFMSGGVSLMGALQS